MNKREASFQTRWTNYLKSSLLQDDVSKRRYGNYELKESETDSVAFNDVLPHQYTGLMASKNTGFVWKFSDADPREKMFDCSCVPPQDGFVVVYFRKKHIAHAIRVEKLISAQQTLPRKSLTEHMASEMSTFSVRM